MTKFKALGAAAVLLSVAACPLLFADAGKENPPSASVSGEQLVSVGVMSEEERSEAGESSAAKDSFMAEETVPAAEEAAQEPELPLYKVMDRVMESCFDEEAFHAGSYTDWEQWIALPEEDQDDRDRLVVLAAAERNGREIRAYGVVSPEYGTQGIILDYVIDGQSNCNYFEWSWSIYKKPQIAMADYDGCGREEVAFVPNMGRGTGYAREYLYLFDTYETGHLETVFLSNQTIKSEVERLLEAQVDEKAHRVDLADRQTGEMIFEGICYDYGETTEEISFKGMCYTDQVRFTFEEDRIVLWVRPGVLSDYAATPSFDCEGERALTFTVNASGGGFTLSDPAEREKTIE